MMNIDGIKRLLPHREPFLFVDEVTKIEGNRIEAYRDIRPDEFYFVGHFPGFPVFPGVLILESIAQVGILLVLDRLGSGHGKKTLFAGIEKAKFKRPVRPGERLLVTAELLAEKAGVYRFKGLAHVGDELACEATATGALRD